MTRSPTSGRRGNGIGSAVALVSVPLMVIAVWMAFSARAPVIAAPRTEPVMVPVTYDVVDESIKVSIALRWSAPVSLAYRGQSGLITAVNVAPGDHIGQGSLLFVVDDHPVRVAVTAAPWSQPVAAKSDPTAIAELNAFLAASGQPANDGSTWGARTARGVQQYAKAMGVEDAVKQFDPAWVVWAPSALAVGEVNVATGFQTPASGEKVLVAAARLGAATVKSSTALDPASYVVAVDGVTITLADAGAVAAESFASLEQVLSETMQSVDAIAHLREPREVLTVPPSSVVTDTRGATCLLSRVPEGGVIQLEGAGFDPIGVEVIGGVPGVTYAKAAEGQELREILSNPSDFASAVHC